VTRQATCRNKINLGGRVREVCLETKRQRGRHERKRHGAAALRARAERLTDQAEAARRRHRSVDAVFDVVDRDAEVGGGIIAGALAYRFFIWMLPLVLVLVAGLGIAADSSSRSPEAAAEQVGLGGLITASVANAANSPARWYALVVGLFGLLWATRSVLRVLIGAHRLIWTEVRAVAPRPTVGATVRLLALLLGFFMLTGLVGALRERSNGLGLLAVAFLVLPYAAVWLLVTLRLPHRDASWVALVPGALVVGVGIQVLHAVTVLFIAPRAIAKQGTYGALGGAAALLLLFFLLSRLMVGAAVLNATLWERQERSG
jgi:uncharacterized BrkB/YihY/UPF0761 family membrane protein